MAKIRLDNRAGGCCTLLPDEFTDNYMAAANGEFVKVYICLLRLSRGGKNDIEMEAMADMLCCTEKDILRALKYWEKQGLLTLETNADGTLASLAIRPLSGQEETAPRPAAKKEKPAVDITAGRMEELQGEQAIKELLFVAEQYLGRPLTHPEMEKFLYFYDGLSMSPELIQYLIEYCVTHGHKSIRYMETVALSWKKQGISTVKAAQETSSMYNRDYYDVLKAMGITGRGPVPDEVSYIDTWRNVYGFDLDLIKEACGRTVLNTGSASFQYADGILSDWKKHNIHTLSDVKEQDRKYREKKEASSRKQPSSPRINRFNNFPQRQYEFSEYEKKLIKK